MGFHRVCLEEAEDVLGNFLAYKFLMVDLSQYETLTEGFIRKSLLNFYFDILRKNRIETTSLFEETTMSVSCPKGIDLSHLDYEVALDHLPGNQAKVRSLFNMGYSQEEISKKLGMTKDQVRGLSFRARKNLKAFYESEMA